MPAYKDKKTGLFYVQFYYRDARGAKWNKTKKGFQTELEALLWEKNFKALKALGRENVGDEEIRTLARNLTEEQAGAFLEESAGSPPGLPTPRRRYGRQSMDRIARASTDERRLVFEAAAQRMALAPAVVEKDFWVCYTLDCLFHRSGFAESMVFKGGTSPSKAFGLIERFSEDIDLILDWRLLGYGEDEPWEPRSNSAQERFKADSIERTNAFLVTACSR